MNYVIGVDLGTTNIKAVLFDDRGQQIAQASQRQQLCYPVAGRVETDPRAWYEVPATLISELPRKAGIDPAAVMAIGVSSQGISFVPVDERSNPLGLGISWLDMRAYEQSQALSERIGFESLYQATGKFPSPAYTVPKVMWLRDNEPALYSQIRHVLMPMDYFIAKMTGRTVTDPSMASGVLLYDLHQRKWSESLAAKGGVALSIFPEIVASGTVAGLLNERSQKLTGLREYTAVVVGAQDQKVAAYAARLHPGRVTLSLGTSAALMCLTNTLGGLPLCPYVDGEMVVETCVNTAGAAIDWARQTILGLSHEEMNALASSVGYSDKGPIFRPLLSGTGTHAGTLQSGALEKLNLECGKAQIARAVYEGVACEIALCMNDIRQCGGEAREILAFGGGSRSSVLCQSIADISRIPLRVCEEEEMAALGAARLAARAIGMDEQAFGVPCIKKEYVPGDGRLAMKVFERYCKDR